MHKFYTEFLTCNFRKANGSEKVPIFVIYIQNQIECETLFTHLIYPYQSIQKKTLKDFNKNSKEGKRSNNEKIIGMTVVRRLYRSSTNNFSMRTNIQSRPYKIYQKHLLAMFK